MNTLIQAIHVKPVSASHRALQEHLLLGLIVAAHLALALYLCRLYPGKFDESWGLAGYAAALATGLVFALCGYTIFVMLFRRPKRLIAYLGTQLKQYLILPRLLYALPVLAMLPIFATSFTIVKAAIPLLHPYAWDARFARLDAFLHGGVQPWEWLQPLLDQPLATAFINVNYHLWFFVMLGMVYWLAFAYEHARLRMQYLLSFAITWILLGNAMAILLSSAGPCYYGKLIDGADPYAGLMTYLHAADQQYSIWALTVQDMLWQSHQQAGNGHIIGISAMPSMHVASSVQLALVGWRLHRLAGIALTVFAALIMIGSVHLGWHYAVDGYVGALGAWIVWKAVERCPWLPAERGAGRDDDEANQDGWRQAAAAVAR